ncbi:MAG: hemolysin III family protein [Ktedonobacteraceae bacterium]|nr:hemolysin III family protein [Ktedonobacteraceae bacterium]MBO0789795.1 hemolysin III family protein [Ktedonobacteraceae bacterium]
MTPIPTSTSETLPRKVKPLLRGWSHAIAAVVSLIFTIILGWFSRADLPRMISLLIFGLSMVELYTVSAIYHIITWKPAKRRVLRAIDHANIFVLIAGTYTPLCFNILTGWVRLAILVVVWLLAGCGVSTSILTLPLPRWLTATLYIGMGWVVVLALPAFLSVLPWMAVATLIFGGILYTAGAVIYARKKPDPWPRIWGYHEVFHLLVILGSIAFAVCVWIWALPFPRQ